MLDKGSNLRDFIHECCWNPNGDRIQGLKLRCFGKFNFTYHGKLQHRSGSSTAAIYIAAMAAIDKGEKESLFYCGSFTAAAIYKGARVDEGGGCQTRRPRLLRHPLLLRLLRRRSRLETLFLPPLPQRLVYFSASEVGVECRSLSPFIRSHLNVLKKLCSFADVHDGFPRLQIQISDYSDNSTNQITLHDNETNERQLGIAKSGSYLSVSEPSLPLATRRFLTVPSSAEHWNKQRRCSYIFDDISSSGRSSSSGCLDLEDESSFFNEQIVIGDIPRFRGDRIHRVSFEIYFFER